MNSVAYNSMMAEIEKGTFTEVSAKNTINNLYIQQALTDAEYNELMEAANGLAANTDDGETNVRLVALEKGMEALKVEVEAIKKAVESGSTSVEEPEEGPSGDSENPIDAYRGMTYYKDKYYRDSEDEQIYKCFRDSDTEPGTGVQLNYLPHELVNIYFYFERVS